MNQRRLVWLGGGTAAVLMVVVGVTTNQVLNNGVWSWPWFAAAVACAAATVVIGRRMAAADQPRPILRRDLVDVNRRPLLVGQVTPRQLGVHPSRFGAHGDSPYIERDVDETLADALRDGSRRLVVVQGPRLAGTTSTLAQAAQTNLAGHHVLVFVDDPRFTVAQMVAQGRRWADGTGAVLWLDDLTPSQLGQLNRALLDDIPAGLWILATVHEKHLEGFRAPEHVTLLLEERAVRIAVGTISDRERDAIRGEDIYSDLRPVLDGHSELLMGRLMVALDQIQNALTRARAEESADRVTLLRAVTDWYRAAMPTLLTRPALKHLYAAYRAQAAGHDHHPPVSTTRFKRALTWATAKASRKRPQLMDLQEAGRGVRWYAPHPLLAVVADDTGQPGAWPVGDPLWAYADRFLTGDQRRDIGYTALDRAAYPHARQLLRHDDTDVEPAALHQVAAWLAQTGDVNGARRWYTKIIGTGHPDEAPKAMFNLGNLEDEQGNPGEARRWWGEAIGTGQSDAAPSAMVNLGVLEKEQGNPGEARRWYAKANATGHPDAAPRAMVNLGVLEQEQGNPGEARRWYAKAIGTGHPDMAPSAMVSLGVLEQEQGNPGEARRWYAEANATGHPDEAPRAMRNLGVLEQEQGNPGEARRWYAKAIATGHPDAAPSAMVNLGFLENGQGNPGEARRWYAKANATGHPDEAPSAMVCLGVLEKEQGNPGEARRWYAKAIATGHPDAAPSAMVNLGVLENGQGNPGEARRWYAKANATGHPDAAPSAMVCLGVLEQEQGNPGEARRWYAKAIATGHPDAAPRAERGLRELDRREEERRGADQFGRYGWQAYADPQLMKPSCPGQDPDESGDEDK